FARAAPTPRLRQAGPNAIEATNTNTVRTTIVPPAPNCTLKTMLNSQLRNSPPRPQISANAIDHQNNCRKLRQKLAAAAAGTIKSALIKSAPTTKRQRLTTSPSKATNVYLHRRTDTFRDSARLGLTLARTRWL